MVRTTKESVPIDTLSRYRPCTDTHPAVSAYVTIGAYLNQGTIEPSSLSTPLVGIWLSLLMRRRQGAYRYMPSTFLEHVGYQSQLWAPVGWHGFMSKTAKVPQVVAYSCWVFSSARPFLYLQMLRPVFFRPPLRHFFLKRLIISSPWVDIVRT